MGLKRILNDKEVGMVVSHLPNRKKPVLVAVLGNCARVIGSFRSEEDAEIFDRTLNLLVLGKEVTIEEIIADEKYHTCGRCKYEDYPDEMYPCNQCKYGRDLREDLWETKDEEGSESE